MTRRYVDWPRRARWPGAVLLVLIVLTLITSKGGNSALYPPKPGDEAPVFLLEDGFHTDIVVPRAAIAAQGGPLAAAAAQTSNLPWMMVGWGDARFYEDQSPWQGRVLDGVAALFGGRRTIVHLEGVWGEPDRVWHEGVHRLVLSREGLAALLARADRSLALGPNAQPVLDTAPHDRDEAFFRSGEDFSAFHLCNHWVAQLLNAAGVPVTPVLDTLPAGLVLDLKLRA